MTPLRWRSAALGAGCLLGSLACGGAPAGPATPEAAPAPRAGKAPGADPLGAWGMPRRKRAWEGAHVAPIFGLGQWAALEVRGNAVRVWDGAAESTLRLHLDSPCEARLEADGSATITHYTLRDGALVAGLGDAGSRVGATAIACVSDAVYTRDAEGSCTRWRTSREGATRSDEPVSCGFVTEGGAERFFVEHGGARTTLGVYGDALLSDQLAATHSEPAASFAAARAERDARAAR